MNRTTGAVEMLRLRAMLDEAGIKWYDDSDRYICRTQARSEDAKIDFSAIYGRSTYGNIELWTREMRENKLDPIGLNTAEEAFALIRRQVMGE